jgi:hypothetical protein
MEGKMSRACLCNFTNEKRWLRTVDSRDVSHIAKDIVATVEVEDAGRRESGE